MNRITAIIVSILLLFSLTSCIYTESDVEEAGDPGYDEGYETGYDEGYDLGYDEGQQSVYDEFGYGSYSQMCSAMEKYEWVLGNLVFIPSGSSTYHRIDCELVQNQNVTVMFYEGANSSGYQPCGQCSYYE